MNKEGTDDELARTIAHIVRANAAHSGRFAAQPGETIQPAQRLGSAAVVAKDDGLELGPLLGQGGMGIVRRARQRVLDRDVAVKSVQPALKSEHVVRMLLQEALILGRLEHPNILPIYDIRYDGADAQIVLKKIDGVAWSSLMHDADVIRRLFAAEDPLDWNIGVLLQVCNAVHFAHSRGFVHRDLKPDNVMIGRFGEVYLMDWGLAVCTHDDGTGRFPLAKDATELAGTPQYMAPEMLGGPEAGITPRTDVYLLGATLYEIIARQPPHRGRDMASMIREVIVSAPPLPDDCPLELGRICHTAMAAAAEARYESAEALRAALSGFVQHAGSRRLSEQALRRTEELLSCLAQPAPHPRGLSERIQMLFGECRFAYRQALDSWPDNELAKAGQARALRAMIHYELVQHNPRSAAALLAGLSDAEPELRARVQEAVRSAELSEARINELERLEKMRDVNTGSRQRALWAGGLGLVWTVAPATGPWTWERWPALRMWLATGFPLTVIAALLLLGYRARQDEESSVTRWLIRGGIVAMLGQLVLEFAARALHLDPVRVEVLWPVVWFCVSAMLTATVDARLLPMTVGFLGAAFLGTVRPDLRFFVMNGSNLIMTVNMFLIWMPRERARASGRPPPSG